MSFLRSLHINTASLGFLLLLLLPLYPARAHEVYVLDHDEVEKAMQSTAPNLLTAMLEHEYQFIASGLIVLAIILVVFKISLITPLEKRIDPALLSIKHFAPRVAQFTLGLALFASGYYNSAFGLELPLADVFGTYDTAIRVLFILLGTFIMLGIFPRIASTLSLLLFLPFVFRYGTYMLNYGTYYGEAFTLALLGGGYALFNSPIPAFEKNIERHWHKYKFLILRIVFGISLIYASVYAKLIYGALALDTVLKYNLTDYFPFDPPFIVLGAFIIELLIGLFFLIGFEIRFTSLVFLGFLTASILFFGEAVWPHIILIGTSLAMFTHGYDKYTLEAVINKRKDLEPVL